MRDRIRRIFTLTEEAPDAIVILNGVEPHLDRTFVYATGVTGGLFEGGAALLWPDGACVILSSRLEADLAEASGHPVETYATREERDAAIAAHVGKEALLGMNAKELTHENFLGLQAACPQSRWMDVSPAIVQARQVKDATEIARIRKACTIAVEAFEELLPALAAGRTEGEIGAELVYLMQSRGASGPSFAPIVASGPNAALPHYATGERVLEEGDFLLMDYGCLYEGYASDVTRTMVLGHAEPRQRRMYDVVLHAQEAALEAMRPGADGKAVHEIAQSLIDATEFKDRFIHGLGHTIGLAVHDGAGMRGTESLVLEEGMALTVEPGVYLPGYGGVRIEDDVLVTRDGVEVLTPATKEFLEI